MSIEKENWMDLQGLKINDTLEIYDEAPKLQQWSLARIKDIQNNKIEIHYYGWCHHFDEWINDIKLSKAAPLNTYFHKSSLHDPPTTDMKIDRLIPFSDNNKIALFTEDNDIVLLDMNTNKIDKITNIKLSFNKCKSLFTKVIDNKLYICKKTDKIEITTFDLLTLKKETNTYFWASLDNVPISDFWCIDDKQYILTPKKLWYLDDMVARNVEKDDIPNSEVRAMGKIGDKRFLLFLDANKEKFIVHDFNDDVKDIDDMKDIDIPMMKDKEITHKSIRSMIIHEHLLLFSTNKAAWIYDIKLEKWFKTKKLIPNTRLHEYFIDGKDNYIYTMYKYANRQYGVERFAKIDLFDVLPIELINEYREKDVLVEGFVNEYVCSLKMQQRGYPMDLIKLILLYYPFFLYV